MLFHRSALPCDVVCRAIKTRLYPAKKIETKKVSKASEYSVLFALLLARLRIAYCCAHRGIFVLTEGVDRIYLPLLDELLKTLDFSGLFKV